MSVGVRNDGSPCDDPSLTVQFSYTSSPAVSPVAVSLGWSLGTTPVVFFLFMAGTFCCAYIDERNNQGRMGTRLRRSVSGLGDRARRSMSFAGGPPPPPRAPPIVTGVVLNSCQSNAANSVKAGDSDRARLRGAGPKSNSEMTPGGFANAEYTSSI